MKTFKDVTLYLSAFVPMYLLILARQVIDLINHNLSFNVLNGISFVLLILLILVGAIGLRINISKSQESSQQIFILSKQNITDQHFLGYFSLFVLFALQLDIAFISDFFIFVFILIFIGIVYIKNSLYYINPLLNILGYSFYDITYSIDGKTERTKMFYKGCLVENNSYLVKIRNENFAFIDKAGKSRK